MIGRVLILVWSCAFSALAQGPSISGRISGGFQAPTTTDAQGRRSVVKGMDATSEGNNLYSITEPRVTSYNADDTAEMFISAPRCRLDMRSNLAWSDSSLEVRTADGRFALEGTGWQWDPRASQLSISNKVTALVEKAALAASLTNQSSAGTNRPPGGTNQVRITAREFFQEGDRASFIGDVLVRDGEDTLKCSRLNLDFQRPGGVQRIEAVRDVDLTQGATEVKSGFAVYDLRTNILTITDSPVWTADRREGKAEKLVLNRASNTLRAEGNVYMKLPLTNVVSASGSSGNSSRTNRFLEIYSDEFEFQNPASNRLAQADYQGHVRAVHAEAAIRCEHLTAIFDAKEQLQALLARGGVEIESQGSHAFGESARYDLAQEKFSLAGEPHWTMNDKSGRSESLVFYPKTEEILALGGVEMLMPEDSSSELIPRPGAQPGSTNAPMRITARTFSHRDNLSVFNDMVRVVDARGAIECQTLSVVTGASNQVQRIVAQQNVRIQQKDLVATGDLADYDVKSGLVHLTGDPKVAGPGKTLRSDSFRIDRRANTFSVAPGSFHIELQLKGRGTRAENP